MGAGGAAAAQGLGLHRSVSRTQRGQGLGLGACCSRGGHIAPVMEGVCHLECLVTGTVPIPPGDVDSSLASLKALVLSHELSTRQPVHHHRNWEPGLWTALNPPPSGGLQSGNLL